MSLSTFDFNSTIAATPDEVFAWHDRDGAFERLMPPWERMRVIERSGGIRDGGRLVFELRKWPTWIRWEARHSGYVAGEQFVDEQIRGPMAAWRHTHRVVAAGRQTRLEDHIEYKLPLGSVGAALGGAMTRAMLQKMFTWRHRRTTCDVLRHQPYIDHGPQRIVIAGASGLVGSALGAFLTTGGHDVRRLVRGKARGGDEIAWDPAAGRIDADALENCDAVIHLGGVSIAQRFTDGHKHAVRASRVQSTTLLAQTIAKLRHKPRVFVCASAVGFYGNRGDEMLTEESAAGGGFLPDVCREWEDATHAASAADVRTVNVRIGIVMTPLGGALQQMLPPFRFGVGGVVGSGRQYMSWIGLDDLIGVIHFSLFAETLRGPVNATGPQPATNREFTHALGRVLRRPTILPLPAFAVRAVFGEMGEALLLGGNRAVPRKLEQAGFRFLCPTLDETLRWELGVV
ncbi:MAG: TIGR01777 family oxidoreductase [Phycisphaerae bacterium]